MDQARGGGDLGVPHCPHRTLKHQGMDMYWVFKVNMNSQYLYGSSYVAGYDKEQRGAQ